MRECATRGSPVAVSAACTRARSVRRPAGVARGVRATHEQRYGYRDDAAEVELVNIRVSAWGPAPQLHPAQRAAGGTARGGRATIVFAGEQLEATYLRGELPPGTEVSGPALCALPEATLLVQPGWQGEVDEAWDACGAVALDAIELQVVAGALRAACEEMGAVLVRSAHSANIKERRDASTGAVRRTRARW